ncbi:histone-fold-containing protein [Moesziomyces antarcticus]|uniref:Related to TATA-binding protein-associated phosphoprotein Dr1 protein n=2 Tax=Pseudozyma antarctica TaxID=84753 RepID=A0A5C3FN61_PSEA2|nr:histone-fold-containing protein [Moesziomyces antarcticus]GAK64820.1 histone-fold-containing protein [Moesziomyces antarcticus]SPO45814.1 related to TATA-binding protein-associated phosphoprotein Dr1 protein [Moesziomyces antarcticus]
MSDDEHFGSAGAAAVDDELSLPKATVQKLISELLPKEVTCSKETRDLLIECCVEFIHLLSSEANEVCEKDSKKTIAPEHVLKALDDLGFPAFIEEAKSVLSEHKAAQKDRERKTTRMEQSGMSEEELQRQQELLFAASKARFEAAN